MKKQEKELSQEEIEGIGIADYALRVHRDLGEHLRKLAFDRKKSVSWVLRELLKFKSVK